MSTATLHTVAAKTRGERLYPPRSSRVHWVLTAIRVEMEAIITRFLPTPLPPGSQLLDFGCGNMPYRSLFEPRVGQYVGCDLQGNEQAECILEQPDRLPFAGGTASVVLSSSVLEHVVDPGTYLAECRRVLADDGLLILSTHGIWRYHPDPLDLWRWTSEGLKRVIQEAGFSILHFRGILGPAATGLQLWQDATLERVPRFIRSLFTRLMQGRIRAADRKCSPHNRDADASVYVLVARKSPTV
jgi:SAM-dependent methyltransferase